VSSTPSESGDSAVAAPLARVALALLALATAGALLIAQHLKTRTALAGSAIWRPSSGVFDPRTSTASFSFTSPYHDHVTVSIVSGETGRVVAVLARNYSVVPYRRTERFPWTGRTATGAFEPNGTYVVQVHFDRLDRTTQVPQASFDLMRPTR
jgi:hypothetical protein